MIYVHFSGSRELFKDYGWLERVTTYLSFPKEKKKRKTVNFYRKPCSMLSPNEGCKARSV